MPNKHGDFIWYELLSNDASAAETFYAAVLGWTAADSGQRDVDYRILSATDPADGTSHAVGGLMQLTPAMCDGGAMPVWLGYIAVDDVDSTVDAITRAGGALQMPAMDVPGVGRIAMVTDPGGAPFYIMRGASDETSFAFAHDRPRIGHCAWNELRARDQRAALAFYTAQFGWQQDGEMDMGELGTYAFLRHGGVIGAVMGMPPQQPAPLWNYYFRVPDIDVAVRAITAGGGTLMMEPQEIPGGEFVINAIDSGGALFALIGAREQGR